MNPHRPGRERQVPQMFTPFFFVPSFLFLSSFLSFLSLSFPFLLFFLPFSVLSFSLSFPTFLFLFFLPFCSLLSPFTLSPFLFSLLPLYLPFFFFLFSCSFSFSPSFSFLSPSFFFFLPFSPFLSPFFFFSFSLFLGRLRRTTWDTMDQIQVHRMQGGPTHSSSSFSLFSPPLTLLAKKRESELSHGEGGRLSDLEDDKGTVVGLRPCLIHREPCFPEAFWLVCYLGAVPGGGSQGPPRTLNGVGDSAWHPRWNHLVLSKASALLPMGCALSAAFWWPLTYRLIKYVDALNASNKIEKQRTSRGKFSQLHGSPRCPPGSFHAQILGFPCTDTSLCACWWRRSALSLFLRSFAPRSSLPHPKFCD